MKRSKLALVGLLVACASFASVSPAWAATNPSSSDDGISITPAIQNKVLTATDKKATFTASVANNTDKQVTVAISTADFSSLNQYGGVAFLGSDPNRASRGHGLSSVLIPSASKLVLNPNSAQDVTVSIKDVDVLAPGGHYGAIIAKVVNSKSDAGKNKLAINQAVSSLIFLETAGEGVRTMNLISLPSQGLSFNLPSEVNLVFKATGNTQIIPRGVVTISHDEHVIRQGVINENSSLILPGSTRLFQTQLTGERHPWLTGSYVLRVQYRYDGSLGVTTYEQRFTYVNVSSVLLLIVGIIALLVGIVWIRRAWAKRKPKTVAL